MLGLALTAIMVMSSAPPLADDVSYQEGLRLFDEFEFEKAVFRFQAALRDESRTGADRATILLRLGMTYAELRDLKRAGQAFDDAIEADPLAALPVDASPKIQLMLNEARQRARDRRAQEQAKAATKAPAPAPAPDENPEPLVDDAPAAPADAPPAEADAGLPWILIGGGATAVAGVVGAVVGAALWGGGVGLATLGNGQTFQSDAAALALPSAVLQVGGQVVLGVGVAVVLGGGAVAVAGLLIE